MWDFAAEFTVDRRAINLHLALSPRAKMPCLCRAGSDRFVATTTIVPRTGAR
jgi:hypothetical protein